MAFPVTIQGAEGEQYHQYTDARWPLGTKLQLQDGREYRFALAGGSALVAGDLQQAAANTANHVGINPASAAPVGSKTVTVTLGSTAAVANEYAGGYLVVDGTAGPGYAYLIDSHPAAGSAGSLVVTLAPGNNVLVALTTSSTVSLIHNPYYKVVINPTSPTQVPAGVAMVAVASGSYGWLQVHGPAPVLTHGTLVLGNLAVPSGTTAGAVDPSAADTGPAIGTVMRVAAAGNYSTVFIDL